MKFEKWIDIEINLCNDVKSNFGLTEFGEKDLQILNEVKSLFPSKKAIEQYLRESIEKGIYQKHMKYIYREYLISEGYIEEDEQS